MMNKKFFDDRISFYKIHQIFFLLCRRGFLLLLLSGNSMAAFNDWNMQGS
ncbi:hypothetical protein O185_20690 [Photorhabdus temperata J3]|uniref:Uncharacterized protein n=1 Tax=Photorhabdus temperata J3 TaxID=1389415 RepID=U7QT97_PHOTE|nr:hypothetical protein O185_20690 [Photorhabdus temperata J3]